MQVAAFVLGNGVSRKPFSIPRLQNNGKVYACNAAYRTDEPDYLIAVDSRMIVEIDQAGYQHTHQVWTNRKNSSNKFKDFNYFTPSKGWSSGPTALWLASCHSHKRIYILGFDYKGIDDGRKVNNIYAGSENYKKQNEPATFFGNWLKQTCSVIKEHPQIQYTRVIQPDNYCPPQLNNFENYNTILLEEFCNALPHDPLTQNGSF
jgi:hypothetical protein